MAAAEAMRDSAAQEYKEDGQEASLQRSALGASRERKDRSDEKAHYTAIVSSGRHRS